MITKNFRNELPMVKYVRWYVAIVGNRRICRRSEKELHRALRDIYIKEKRIIPPEEEELENDEMYFFGYDIDIEYDKGYFIKISTDSKKNEDVCYLIDDSNGEIITKSIEEIRFLNSDKILEDSKDLNETLDRFYDLEMMVGQLMIEDTFEDFIELVTLVLQNKLIKENIVKIAKGFEDETLINLFAEIEKAFEIVKGK